MSSLIQTYVPLAFVLVVALTIHEFAHAWVAFKLGDRTAYDEGRVTLNPIVHLDPMGTLCFIITQGFGWAKPVPVNPNNLKNPRRDDILITAAGPFSNFVLGAISAFVFYALIKLGVITGGEKAPLADLGVRVLQVMIYANFVLMMFNLLPLYPLDGFHIVQNLLPLNQAYEFKRFNEAYGPYILLGLVLLGMSSVFPILSYIISPPIEFLNWAFKSLAFAIF